MADAKSDENLDDLKQKTTNTGLRDKAETRKLSRLERLKKKIKKIQGKDPDIYPMW